MKKIFTLLAGVLFALGAQAQTTYDFAGLTVSMFDLGDGFTDGGTWKDEGGSYGEANKEYACITYSKKDKTNWSDLKLTGTPIIFQYKNSSEKKQFYRLFDNFFYANGKQSRITVTGLTAGQVVTFVAAGKNADGCLFSAVDNCTADAGNPTSPVVKEMDITKFTDFKFTATADGSITVEETSGGYHLAFIKIEGGGVTPANPHEAATWNFTTVNPDDITNLDADTQNWTKTTEGEDPNQFVRYSNAFVVAKVADANNSTKLEANGVELDYAKGLLFGRYNNKINAGNIRIDYGKRLGLNGSDVVLMIEGMAAGDKVKINFSSTNTESRGFTITNGTPSSISAEADPTVAEITADQDGVVELKTTKGVYVYALAVNAELPSIDTGISVIRPETTTENGAIYNLQGQRVDANYRGVVIMNGKKMIQK